ncbi:hypothetical protein [Xanthomonas theicola]|nr:hypothetical protein [Xanthomonas theicola]
MRRGRIEGDAAALGAAALRPAGAVLPPGLGAPAQAEAERLAQVGANAR